MILDTFKNAQRYETLHEGFAAAFAFLSRSDIKNLSEGKYEIDSDRVFATVFKGMGRSKDEALLETHQKYIDIQWVLAGSDCMGWKPSALCQGPTGEYDSQKDLQFFSDDPDSWIETKEGSFVIFYPQDAHMPLISSGEIHKVIVKVKVEK